MDWKQTKLTGASRAKMSKPSSNVKGRAIKLPRPSIRFAQNFLKDSSIVALIVSQSDLCKNDIVYEIGPGQGIITLELSKVCSKVVAVEVERRLYNILKTKFRNINNIDLINADFLKLELPVQDYKVFSNIPFNITAKVLRKLLHAEHPPTKAYLILQREAAKKYAGVPRETQASILLKPWFIFDILHNFERVDFDPVPNVDVVLLGIEKRLRPLVSSDEAILYRQFVNYGFGRWRANLGKNYKKVFSHIQWKRLSKDLGFNIHAQPTDLTFDQWYGIFQFFHLATKKGQVTIPDDLRLVAPNEIAAP